MTYFMAFCVGGRFSGTQQVSRGNWTIKGQINCETHTLKIAKTYEVEVYSAVDVVKILPDKFATGYC